MSAWSYFLRWSKSSSLLMLIWGATSTLSADVPIGQTQQAEQSESENLELSPSTPDAESKDLETGVSDPAPLTFKQRTLLAQEKLPVFREDLRLVVDTKLLVNDFAGFIPGLPPTILARFHNAQNAETYGFELNGQWEIHEHWRLRVWYSLLKMQIHGPVTLLRFHRESAPERARTER